MGVSLLMAQANVTPPIPVVWAVLQTLGVMLLAFIVLVLVMSHLRYQNELKRLEAVKKQGMQTDDLRLWILERIRKTRRCLVLFRCETSERSAVFSMLREHIRKGDELLEWRDEGVLLLFAGDDALNAERAGLRLGGFLVNGQTRGAVTSAVSPDPLPMKGLLKVVDGILDRLRAGDLPESGWSLPAVSENMESVVPEHERPLLDEVTGVLRQERVPTAVQKILASHRRVESPVCLVLCEVDDLGAYSGDGVFSLKNSVLKAAAGCLMRNCRETDLVGRMSDKHFVLVLAGEVAQIDSVVGRMLERVRHETVLVEGQTYRFTLSAGIAGYPEHGAGPQHLFAACQEAVEAAKGRGRGHHLVYDPAMRVPVERPKPRGSAPDAF